jgi:tetratricopeptide (TPR) repeat protein
MHKASLFFTLLGLIGATVCARADSGLQAEIDRFRAAQRVWNGEAMERARDGFAQEAARSPETYPPLYWQSVSEFYLMLFYGLEESAGFNPDQAKELLDAAEETMRAAIETRPQEAECRAMLSSVIGFRIKNHPFSAVWNGPKVLSLQSDALENEPDNPRVLYIIGAGYFRAPRLFRNVDKARELITKAQRIFEETPESTDPSQPRWGRAECSGLLGDLYLDEGNAETARTYYQKALRANPDYIPAQERLKELKDERKK